MATVNSKEIDGHFYEEKTGCFTGEKATLQQHWKLRIDCYATWHFCFIKFCDMPFTVLRQADASIFGRAFSEQELGRTAFSEAI